VQTATRQCRAAPVEQAFGESGPTAAPGGGRRSTAAAAVAAAASGVSGIGFHCVSMSCVRVACVCVLRVRVALESSLVQPSLVQSRRLPRVLVGGVARQPEWNVNLLNNVPVLLLACLLA
jgi:hypothetical protein